MPFDVYDYRQDVRNVVVRPEIRSRFLRMEPGEAGPRHSHDTGQEVFLVLDGQCRFEIAGEERILGPGQMCVANADEIHQVWTEGDQPMTMYLSVTPHLEPTHTLWDESGQKLPPAYGYWAPAGHADNPPPLEDLVTLAERVTAATHALAETASTQAAAQADEVTRLSAAVAAEDREQSKEAVDAIWAHVHDLYDRFLALETAWNALALKTGQSVSLPDRG